MKIIPLQNSIEEYLFSLMEHSPLNPPHRHPPPHCKMGADHFLGAYTGIPTSMLVSPSKINPPQKNNAPTCHR